VIEQGNTAAPLQQAGLKLAQQPRQRLVPQIAPQAQQGLPSRTGAGLS
jgi:hypothetical protein